MSSQAEQRFVEFWRERERIRQAQDDRAAQQAEEFLAFRHIVRNIYGFELNPERVERAVEKYPEAWGSFESDVRVFPGLAESTCRRTRQVGRIACAQRKKGIVQDRTNRIERSA